MFMIFHCLLLKSFLEICLIRAIVFLHKRNIRIEFFQFADWNINEDGITCYGGCRCRLLCSWHLSRATRGPVGNSPLIWRRLVPIRAGTPDTLKVAGKLNIISPIFSIFLMIINHRVWPMIIRHSGETSSPVFVNCLTQIRVLLLPGFSMLSVFCNND